MSKKLITIFVVLTFATLSFAQKRAQPTSLAAPLAPATISCSATYSSGSGHNATTYCVTVNGNIPQFSRDGQEMIFVGAVQEGYGVCDFNSGVAYFDYANYDSGNWNPSTLTFPNANTAVSTRTTSDGIWKLTNTIIRTPATASGPEAATVKMAIHNMTGISRGIFILRYADVDADSDPGNNDFDFTVDTAYGLHPGFLGGLGSTNNTFTFGYDAYAQSTYDGPPPCSPFNNIAPQPFHGDGSVVQLWSITVPASATKTVVMVYKPI